MFRAFSAIALLVGLVLPGRAVANDYPAAVRAEYIVACMLGDPENSRRERRCSCAIDRITAGFSYDRYVAAETVLRMRKVNGEKGSLFRESATLRDTVNALRDAEAEARMECF